MTDHAERLQPGGFRMFGLSMACPDERCKWRITASGVSLATLLTVAKNHLGDPVNHLGDPVMEEGLEP
jgi:hypothetical protein